MNSDPVTRWEDILRSRYWDELLALAGSDNSSLYVKFSDLERCDPEFARELLERPEKMLGTARAALLQIDLPKDAHLDRVQVRITELPGHFSIVQLNSALIDKLIAIEGRVVKADKARSRRVSVHPRPAERQRGCKARRIWPWQKPRPSSSRPGWRT